MLKNTADTFFLVILNENGQRWQALSALTNNSTLTLNSVIGSVNIEAKFIAVITPSPPITEATLTVTTCQPKPESAEATCLLPAGQTIPLNRIF